MNLKKYIVAKIADFLEPIADEIILRRISAAEALVAQRQEESRLELARIKYEAEAGLRAQKEREEVHSRKVREAMEKKLQTKDYRNRGKESKKVSNYRYVSKSSLLATDKSLSNTVK